MLDSLGRTLDILTIFMSSMNAVTASLVLSVVEAWHPPGFLVSLPFRFLKRTTQLCSCCLAALASANSRLFLVQFPLKKVWEQKQGKSLYAAN